MSMTDQSPLPAGLRALTWAGVVPFAATLLVAALYPAWGPLARTTFVAYGAVILSFLGGTRWALALLRGRGAGWLLEAVLPSLLGFAALLLAHRPMTALVLLAIGFAVWLRRDLADAGWPPDYRRLRLQISLAVLTLHLLWWLPMLRG